MSHARTAHVDISLADALSSRGKRTTETIKRQDNAVSEIGQVRNKIIVLSRKGGMGSMASVRNEHVHTRMMEL